MLLTAGLVAYSAFQTARGSDASRDLDAHAARRDSWWRLATIGLGAGLLSGLLGVGGGILMVPLFVQWLHMPIKNAIGTSLACVGILAVPSFVVHQIQGDINWLYAAPLCLAVIPGARVGAHLAITSAEHVLRRAVGICLGIVYALARNMPGDPLTAQMGEDPSRKLNPEDVARMRRSTPSSR